MGGATLNDLGIERWPGANLIEDTVEVGPGGAWLDLSAIPAPARPALAEALQAAVARLAEGGAGLDPTRAGDALLRELIRRQKAGMLREAAAEPRWQCGCGTANIPAYLRECDSCGRPREERQPVKEGGR